VNKKSGSNKTIVHEFGLNKYPYYNFHNYYLLNKSFFLFCVIGYISQQHNVMPYLLVITALTYKYHKVSRMIDS
jgi:hypothetical protein